MWLYKAVSRLALIYMFTVCVIGAVHDLRGGTGSTADRVLQVVLLVTSAAALVATAGY